MKDFKGEAITKEAGNYLVTRQRVYRCSKCPDGRKNADKSVPCPDCLLFRNYTTRVKNERASYIGKLHRKYKTFQNGAWDRGHDFNISVEEFEKICEKQCYYCGSNDNIGMDRLDNKQDYMLDNVVPCCGKCNIMKSKYTENDFIEHINKIAEYQKVKKGQKRR